MKFTRLFFIAGLVCCQTIASAQWGLSGNSGTTPGLNYIGTSDDKALMFKTNGTQKMLIDIDGNIQSNGANQYLRMSDRLTLQTIYTPVNNYTRGILSSNIRWNSATDRWKVEGGPYDDFTMIRFENNGLIGFYTRQITGSSYEMTNSDLNAYQRMFIDNTGNVGINTDDTRGFRFAVNGNAIFTSATVKLRQNWPDYVFEKDYQLLPLSELEKFIQQNKHLPDVPAAAEVEKEGLDLGSNQAVLLKKIEELTLYIIEQNKEIQLIKAKLLEQEKKANDPVKSKE